MDATKPDPGEHAPEVFSHIHDDGPILVPATYTQDRFECSPEQQQKLNSVHSGYTPVHQYPPQYQHQGFAEPTAPTTHTPDQKKRAWVGWTVGLIVGILSALGAGIGIGYAVGENVSNSATANNSSSSTVTSGSTGIAAFDCSRDKVYASPFGASFAQDCYVSYKTNQTSYDNSSIIVKNFAGITVYSFGQCMDECQQRNLQLNIGNALGERCTAVSYYANLTYSTTAWAGNCFLKNARGIGKNWDTNSNETLTASGYMVTLS